MKCPFTGKVCVYPKEIVITEDIEGVIKNLHLCKKCGDDYIEKIDKQNIISQSKSIETITSDGNKMEIEENELETAQFSILEKIEEMEKAIKHAISEERYEDAHSLKGAIQILKDDLEKLGS